MNQYLRSFFLLISLFLSQSTWAQLYIENTVLYVDSTDLTVDDARLEVSSTTEDTYLYIMGQGVASLHADTIVNYDTIHSTGKVIINSLYQSLGGAAYFLNGTFEDNQDSLIIKGDWQNEHGGYGGGGIISFAATADTQYINNASGFGTAFHNLVIDGGGHKMVQGNLLAKNAFFYDGVLEAESNNDTIAFTYGPSIHVEGTTSYVEGGVFVQDTGDVLLPTGDDGFYRPVLIEGIKSPTNWTAPTNADDVASARDIWRELPFLRAETNIYSNTGTTDNDSHKTFAERSWRVDLISGNVDSAHVSLFFDNNDLAAGVTFSPAQLVVMNNNSLASSNTYDTLGLYNSGFDTQLGLNFVKSNVTGSEASPYFFVGTVDFVCPSLASLLRFEDADAPRCIGGSAILEIDTVGTDDATVAINQVLWQDSTVVTNPNDSILLYEATGGGFYSAIITYNNFCNDTTNYLKVDYKAKPEISFDKSDQVRDCTYVADYSEGLGGTADYFDIAQINDGSIYVSDATNNQIIKLANGAIIDRIDASPKIKFQKPLGLATYNSQVFVADSENKMIRRINTLYGNMTRIYAGNGTSLNTSSREGDNKVSGIFENPIDLAIDGAKNIYVLDDGLNVIRVVYDNGSFSTIGLLEGETQPTSPKLYYHDFGDLHALAINEKNELLIADGTSLKLASLDDSTIVTKNVKVSPRLAAADLGQVTNIISTEDGYFILSLANIHQLARYDTDTDSLLPLAGVYETAGHTNDAIVNASFNTPVGVVFDEVEDQYLVVDQGNSIVRRVKDSTYASFCSGASAIAELNVSSTGGTYVWEYNGEPVSDEYDAQIEIARAGKYKASYTDNKGCISTETLQLEYLEPVLAQVNIYGTNGEYDTVFCQGAEVTIDTDVEALQVDDYTWLDKSKNVALSKDEDFTFNPSSDSTIYLAMKEDICEDTIRVQLSQIVKPNFSFDALPSIACNKTSIPISASLGLKSIHPIVSKNIYGWSVLGSEYNGFLVDEDSVKAEYVVEDEDVDNKFAFEFTFDNGCGIAKDTTDSVLVVGRPEAKIVKDPPQLLSTTVTEFAVLDSSTLFTEDKSHYTYSWFFGGELTDGVDVVYEYDTVRNERIDGLQYLPGSSTERGIRLTVTDTVNGCVGIDSVTIRLVTYKVLYLPNAFAPNSAQNDENKVFKCYGVNISDQNFKLKVFNRWGEVVYETADYVEASEVGWNGKAHNTGIDLESGVYTYTLVGEFLEEGGNTNEPFSRAGAVTLIR